MPWWGWLIAVVAYIICIPIAYGFVKKLPSENEDWSGNWLLATFWPIIPVVLSIYLAIRLFVKYLRISSVFLVRIGQNLADKVQESL